MSGPQRQPDADEHDCTCGHAWTDGIHELNCITAQWRLRVIEADPNKAIRDYLAQPADPQPNNALTRIADALERIAVASEKAIDKLEAIEMSVRK